MGNMWISVLIIWKYNVKILLYTKKDWFIMDKKIAESGLGSARERRKEKK